MKAGPVLSIAAALGTLAVVFGPRWHHPVQGHQMGPPGTSMVQWDPAERAVVAMNAPPATDGFGVAPAALADPRPATEAYANIQALKGGTAGEFMTLHVAMTNWVAARQGCAFCHQGADFAADTKPQKAAARTMIAMTRTLNTTWRGHVGEAGVTCFTCHRGQNVPQTLWYPRPAEPPRPFVARQDDWHETATTVRDFFPDNGFAQYLLQDTPGRGQSTSALPDGGGFGRAGPGLDAGPAAPVVVKRLYEVMMQMSDGIGVNCGYCHNSRAFFDWSQSTPARWTALEGIHMTQAINHDILLPLAAAIPQLRTTQGQGRLPITPAREAGAQNGNGLAVCATCHYGSPKPLPGQDLLAAYPTLRAAP